MATLVFDYDGTLHDCLRIYTPAFQLAYDRLAARELAQPRRWASEELKQWLGLSAPEMWRRFAPSLPETERETCSRIIGEEMLRQIAAGNARLYPGVPELLSRLRSAGHRLVFLSACKREYLSLHRKVFQLEDYFAAFFCAEAFDWAEKTEMFPAVQRQFPGPYVIIGDRHKDRELAETFRLPFIGCAYGYALPGELEGAFCLVHAPAEIETAAEQLLTAPT